ncbi:MAG TPA: SURF1 family protein [Acidimicrobiia bacterium]|nr:SURF1 family protein [Acidimicrobiia bacterium]
MLVVLTLTTIFIRLGFWQLERMEERRVINAEGEERISQDPIHLPQLLAEADGDFEPLEFRRVLVTGHFDPESEVLIRSQVELGQAGFHVITPLVADDGRAVLVNRGWVPLTMDTPPVGPRPPSGEEVVEGWVQLTQTRPAFGPDAQPGEERVFNRVDIARIAETMSYDLAPVFVVQVGERGNDLPILVSPPDFADGGPHLSYAIQWFGFAAVVLVGFFFLIRRKGPSRTSDRSRGIFTG